MFTSLLSCLVFLYHIRLVILSKLMSIIHNVWRLRTICFNIFFLLNFILIRLENIYLNDLGITSDVYEQIFLVNRILSIGIITTYKHRFIFNMSIEIHQPSISSDFQYIDGTLEIKFSEIPIDIINTDETTLILVIWSKRATSFKILQSSSIYDTEILCFKRKS